MKLRTNKKRIVQKYLVEYMFGKINKSLMWFYNEEEMNEFIDYIKSYSYRNGNSLTYYKKYEIKEIQD